MSIHASLNHKTRYRYDRKVSLSPQIIRLRPAPHTRTGIESYSLRVSPEPHFLNWLQDPQGNWLARVVFPEKVDHFEVEVDLLARIEVFNPFDFFIQEDAAHFPFSYHAGLKHELEPFLKSEPAGERLTAYLQSVNREKTPIIDFLVRLNQQMQQQISYVVRMEPGVQNPEETLEKAKGSCRDSGWLMVQVLRHLGIAARFVSGYLIQLKPDVKSLDGPSGTDHDFTDLHAWAEAYIPGAGWVGLDATSGLFAGEGHIPLVATPEPSSAAPITGGLEPCDVKFEHEMRVSRLRESPRVTLPYTERQWQAVDALGARVDKGLKQEDVRLTMGGEPTFVSIDDQESAQWNTEALGEDKERLSVELIRRLRAQWAPAGMLAYEQGKWYPGEPLPRWAYSLYWRADGKPLLADPERFVLHPPEGHESVTEQDASAFLAALAVRLGVDTGCVAAGYEDPLQAVIDEQRLPENLKPDDPQLRDAAGRNRLATVLSRGLGTPVGHYLPLRREGDEHGKGRRWLTEPWRFRSGQMLLIPGDSPMGLRMPLASLPWLPKRQRHEVLAQDPMAPRGPLPASFQSATAEKPPAKPVPEKEGVHSRTALVVEPHDGLLTVFMPPLEQLEDYLSLLAAIEAVAREKDCSLRIEGYPPPRDHRLKLLKVTPDPGVIEVNVQPAADWEEAKRITTELYEAARLSRLGTEKFIVDGRHVGTGGGNHIVVGAADPADSPFLRRPDLLGSLLRFWQNHPSLTYLFSGMFIGPTSQAPRVDEAREDSLYELEIALQQLPVKGEECAPWIVDRILRHLLTDITGNTHRAEFCIDKLYSPDTATGRLGLVEFRNFEMPPHGRMSLVQQLLLRALILRCWRKPYTRPLQRWGTRLHDDFMLQHFVMQDFADVLADLRDEGFAFDPAWFDAHAEFRFPKFGQIQARGMTLELRHALEPWLVLGEEAAGGGTARYVDSSVERVQVKLSGLVDQRYLLACNGRRVPLRGTGVPGEYVAGVRFRAWQPWSCLHPTIGVQGPLVFDLIDSWSQRAIAGCTWHVAHPAGRNYESPPVNANAAESRRLERFQPFGHTPGEISPPRDYPNPSLPLTLDLRFHPARSTDPRK